MAALFADGLLSDLLVRTIVSRTSLIEDPEAMAAVDTELAARVTRWGALSAKKTEQAIDELVDKHDPGAVRRTVTACAQETVQFGCPIDPAGITTIWARINDADATLMETNVEATAHSVCDADPRTIDQRRSHAFAARTNGTAFTCRCGDPDCGAGVPGDAPARNAVVYVVAENNTLDAATNPQTDVADDPLPEPEPEPEPKPHAEPEPEAAPEPDPEPAPEPVYRESRLARPKPAYLFGAGIMPTALLGAVVERARFRQVRHPGADSAPEPRYTPSRALAEFVRCRDLTCRFPGCDKPADVCDLDHTVAYPVGPTHPSNLKCLCRFHYLLKTFWNALGGWCAYPGGLHLFPQLCKPTATLWTGDPPTVKPAPGRGVMTTTQRPHVEGQLDKSAVTAAGFL